MQGSRNIQSFGQIKQFCEVWAQYNKTFRII